jgi:hypothetical protein
LCSSVAFLMARFSLRSDSQLMWVRVVTGSDIVGFGQEKTRRLLYGLFSVAFAKSSALTMPH